MAYLPVRLLLAEISQCFHRDRMSNFQSYCVKSETLTSGGMTQKTFANSSFHIDFDINYKSFLRDWLRTDEN